MKNVYEILRQKKVDLKALQEEVDALEIAARLLGEEHDRAVVPMDEEPSQPQMIRAILLAQGKSMLASDISEAISLKYHKFIKPEYIAATIYRYIKKHKYFAKTDSPNTFALIEWTETDQTAPVPTGGASLQVVKRK
jgi:hypothetical protein